MDTSGTLTGKRERAPAEGAMDSHVPGQSADTKCRLGDLHPAFAMEKEEMTGHAQWRRSDMRDKIDAQTRKDPGALFAMDGGWPVLSARVAEERKRFSDRT